MLGENAYEVLCLVKYLAHSKNSGNPVIISVVLAINSVTPSYLPGILGSNFLIL